jgi:hypothetical protein
MNDRSHRSRQRSATRTPARLRKHVIDVDAVLRTATLIAKSSGDGKESVNSGDVALVTGLSESFVEKVLTEKWGDR